MPQNRKKQFQNSAPSQALLPTVPTGISPSIPLPVLNCPTTSGYTAVYPSFYSGGVVTFEPPPVGLPGDPNPDRVVTLKNIVSQTEYSHLSPEELRFRDLNINSDFARWELSTEEARLRYYFDEGLASVPQFGPPTPAPAFSVSSGVKPTSSEAESADPDSRTSCFELGCPTPVDGQSATSLCSRCASKPEADAEEDEPGAKEDEPDAKEGEAASEGLGRDTPTSSISRHSDTRAEKKRSRIRRRVSRLEKTVEGLSQGLILALTELRDTRGQTTSSSTVDALSTALSGLSTEVDHPDSTSKTSAPDATLLNPSEQHDPATQRESTSSTKLGAHSGTGESKVGSTAGVATEKHTSFLPRSDRSPISGLLKPILDFMTCPEVLQFLKRAEAHPGLRSTQLSDLFWVSDNLFNVHGGVLMYCLQRSFTPMDAISIATGSSAWSEDLELLQKLDETYRKYLRPYIETDGGRNSVAKVAWESYCFEVGSIFSEQLPDWQSATSFFQNISREYDRQVPMITSSYIQDLSALWREVHPALLEITRWLEPFIDYGPDYHHATPLYDATIALGRHARELYNRQGGIKEIAIFATIRYGNLMRLLCERRSGDLKNMQREIDSVMNSVCDPVNFDAVAALVDRAKQATLWRAADPHEAQMQNSQAQREVRAMMGYRPRLLREGAAAARIRREVLGVLMQTASGRMVEGGLIGEREVFWDGL